MNSDVQVKVTASTDLSSQLTGMLSDMITSGGFWLIISLIAAMVVMQGVKAVLKAFIPNKFKKARTWITFVLAYFVGYFCGLYFLTGDDAEKWATLIGLINPCIYFVLVQYAVARKKMVLLSLLKMRPLTEHDGEVKLSETHTFLKR